MSIATALATPFLSFQWWQFKRSAVERALRKPYWWSENNPRDSKYETRDESDQGFKKFTDTGKQTNRTIVERVRAGVTRTLFQQEGKQERDRQILKSLERIEESSGEQCFNSYRNAVRIRSRRGIKLSKIFKILRGVIRTSSRKVLHRDGNSVSCCSATGKEQLRAKSRAEVTTLKPSKRGGIVDFPLFEML